MTEPTRRPRRPCLSLLPALLPALLASLLLLPRADAAPAKRKVILDDDGFGLAQWMVLKAPDTEVLGMGVVSGDVWRDEGVAQALRGMEIAGRGDVPVLPGAVYPLLNSEQRTEAWEALYGKLVWKGAWMKRWVEPNMQGTPDHHAPEVVPHLADGDPQIHAASEPAAMFMIRKVHEFPGQISIIATGPLTDLALAQRLDPGFAGLAKELVYMGGALNPHQERQGPAAAQFAREFVNAPRHEFNMWFDPEAASIVFHAPWKKIVMVPADAATATELTPALIARLAPDGSPMARAIRRRMAGFPLWDEIAAAIWLDLSLVTRSDRLYVDANTVFGPDYGATLSWTPGYQPDLGEQPQEVVRRIDVSRFEAMMARLLTGTQPAAQGAPVP